MTLPSLSDLASAAVLAVAAIVAVRLVYLTVIGLLYPSLFIEDAHGADASEKATGIAELLESELSALREEGGGPSLQLLTTMDAAIDLGTIEAEGSRLKEIGALLRLLPGRTTRVTTRLQPAGALGEGLSITMGTTTNRVAATTTLWEGLYVRADDLPADVLVDTADGTKAKTEVRNCLALAGAAWIAYQALRSASIATRSGLLTQDWESYAMFRVGARMQFLELRTLARRLYMDALVRDPRNRGALFNLAVLDFQEANERSAIARLMVVLAELERNPLHDNHPWTFDRLWYRAMYNIAAADWNKAFRRGRPSSAVRRRVIDRIRELVAAADQTIEQLGGADGLATGGRHASLIRFLVDVRSASIVLYKDAVGEAV